MQQFNFLILYNYNLIYIAVLLKGKCATNHTLLFGTQGPSMAIHMNLIHSFKFDTTGDITMHFFCQNRLRYWFIPPNFVCSNIIEVDINNELYIYMSWYQMNTEQNDLTGMPPYQTQYFNNFHAYKRCSEVTRLYSWKFVV